MSSLRRCLLAAILGGLLLGAVAPGVSAATGAPARFPVQGPGNRGTDVKAIQLLLADRGHPVAANGIFDGPTADAVNAFKASIGLAPNGIGGQGAWEALARPLRAGDSGPAVTALQRQLRAKHAATVAVDGAFGPASAGSRSVT